MTNPTVKSPRVSICVPTYNGSRYLAETLASASGQTVRDIEILVSDDDSSDDTLEVAAAAAALDPRLRILPSAGRLGPQENWNRALRDASGRYVKLLCQDDVLEPDCLERQSEALDLCPEAALTTCGRRILNSASRRTRLVRRFGTQGRVPSLEVFARLIKTGTNLIGEPSAVLFRRDLIQSTGVFDAWSPYLIDLDYWCRLLEHGDLYAIETPLCGFRIFPDSWSSQLASRQAGMTMQFMRRLHERHPSAASALRRRMGSVRTYLNACARRALFALDTHLG